MQSAKRKDVGSASGAERGHGLPGQTIPLPGEQGPEQYVRAAVRERYAPYQRIGMRQRPARQSSGNYGRSIPPQLSAQRSQGGKQQRIP